MDAEKVWERALGLIRAETTRAIFDTWIRDSVGLDFSDNVIKVGVANEYTRNWLEEGLTSIAEKRMTELLGCSAKVRFVVDICEDTAKNTSFPELETGKDGCEEDAEKASLETRYLSLYDEIVRPERVIVIPHYYLRWIPWLGVDLAWLPIGFRQAAFIHGCPFEAGETFEASAKNIIRWSGLSLRTFWRRVNDPLLRWFIEPMDEGEKKWVLGKDGRPHRAPNRWWIVMSMPLTPVDQVSLRNWLGARLKESQSPIKVLQEALETPVEILIPWPRRVMPTEIGGEPHSVQDVVIETMKGIMDPMEEGTIRQLADGLAGHVVKPGSVILVAHYFAEKWLPLLGAGPGWLVTLLRSRCYYNRETEESRDTVTIEGGYEKLARMLGYSRSYTVAEWFRGRGESRGKVNGAEWLSYFFIEAHRQKRSTNSVSVTFQVRMCDEPLIPEDQIRYEQRTNEIANNAVGTIKGRATNAIDTHRIVATLANDTHRGEGTNAVDTLGKGGNQREWHRLKDSLKGLHLGKDLKRLSTTTSREKVNGRNWLCRNDSEVVVGHWDLSQLLLINRVDARVRAELVKQGVSAESFVSWLLYAASPRGESIENPISHAISRLRQAPKVGAGEAFDRLAELSPQELICLIERALQGTDKWVNNVYWRSCMESASKARLHLLVEQLGIRIEGKGV